MIPAEVQALIDDAHRKFMAHRNGSGSLHDSSSATTAARDALMHWAMNVIYTIDADASFDESDAA